jgi:hypothetical protein
MRSRGNAATAIAGLALTVVAVLAAAEPAAAYDSTSSPALRQTELFAGVDHAGGPWALWTGVTLAPFGSIRDEGWRLRAVAGGGRYTFTGQAFGEPSPSRYQGIHIFADALIGYQMQLGPWTAKAFAGIAYKDRVEFSKSTGSVSRVARTGAKLALENWFTLTERAWATLDGNWSSAGQAYWTRGRLGYRIWNDLSIGPEAGASGDDATSRTRFGGFARYAWDRGEVTLSAGVMQDRDADRSEPYAAVEFLMRF